MDTLISQQSAVSSQRTIRYQFSNHLGSASLELDEKANSISYEEYHPFGTSAYRSGRNETEVSLKRYRYSGKERDEETGLYYYGARHFIAWLGRWSSADPAGFVDGLNVFSFIANRAICFVDKEGRNASYFIVGAFIGLASDLAFQITYNHKHGRELDDIDENELAIAMVAGGISVTAAGLVGNATAGMAIWKGVLWGVATDVAVNNLESIAISLLPNSKYSEYGLSSAIQASIGAFIPSVVLQSTLWSFKAIDLTVKSFVKTETPLVTTHIENLFVNLQTSASKFSGTTTTINNITTDLTFKDIIEYPKIGLNYLEETMNLDGQSQGPYFGFPPSQTTSICSSNFCEPLKEEKPIKSADPNENAAPYFGGYTYAPWWDKMIQ